MAWRVRRVVTGHNANGRSCFYGWPCAKHQRNGVDAGRGVDRPVENHDVAGQQRRRCGRRGPSGQARTAQGRHDPSHRRISPGSQWRGRADAGRAFNSIGAGHAPDHASDDPMRHKTSTVDYISCSRADYALMDKGETLLKAGDILIQRGTNHSWSVRGNEPCIVAAILVNARPV